MAKVQPVKNTVGEGFSVEELVVASLACHMLSDLPWSGADGAKILNIQCQTRQDGWFFDDAVVQTEKDGIKRACGCSIKSFALFTPSGAPRELSVALWQQWRAPASSPFRAGHDSMVLIAAQHEPSIREAWVGLTESARAISPEIYGHRFASGIEPSPLRRNSFQSIRKGTPDQVEASCEEAARLLRSFHLWEHDFQYAASESNTWAIALCQQALADDSRAKAPELWNAIIGCVVPIRRKGGEITLEILLSKLANRFPLKHHPSYAGDWALLESESRNRIEGLPSRIGGTVSLGREKLAGEIEEKVKHRQLVTLVGHSGNGKSVLARDWVRKSTGAALWLRASDLGSVGGIQSVFHLQYDLPKLLGRGGKSGRLVMDGFDKCFADAAFDEAALILAAITLGPAQDRWETLITCCPEDWERVQRKLLQRGFLLSRRIILIERFTQKEVRQACSTLPQLTGLVQRPHLQSLLSWPKVLDLVATYGRTGNSSEKWASESDFVWWFWQSAICQEYQASPRDRVARKLAVLLGDLMLEAVSLEQFTTTEVEVLADLSRDGHVEIDPQQNTARFPHDLLGDWARLRELQIQQGKKTDFIRERLHSPLWHRAVRYYALELLDQRADAVDWQRLFGQFTLNSTTDILAQNLMLEAPVFAADQCAIMNRLWPLLEAEDGVLFQRFLKQFLQVATQPDDDVLSRIEEKDSDLRLEFAAHYRIPWAPYWFGVIEFLGQHVDQAITLAREEVADLCLLWLPLHRAIPNEMETVATLAVNSARQFYRSPLRERHLNHHGTSPEEKVCQALLLAAPLLPGPTKELVLKLSGRLAPATDEVLPKQDWGGSIFCVDPGEPVPWLEGPQWGNSPAFCSALMKGRYAAELCESLPEVAAEALFGVLLNIPFSNSSPDDSMNLDEHGFDREWNLTRSSFWTNGPFVAFLNRSPNTALSMIIRLANFATDRGWELPQYLRERIAIPVNVSGETRKWRGTQWSLLWHKGHVFGARAVCCSLLSLEFWFYQLQDAEESIAQYLTTVLEESRSIALAGVLISVGKRNPDLFLGPLKPIVEAVDLHWMESYLNSRGEDGYAACNFDSFGSERDLVRDWVSMPHRKEALGDLVLRLFLSHQEWRAMIEEILPRWRARLDGATPEQPAPAQLASTLARFDLKNWEAHHSDDSIEIAFTPPPDLPGLNAEEHAQMERTQLLLLLPFECHRVLVGEIKCDENKMTEWWALLGHIGELVIPEEDYGFRNHEDALLGIVSVALVYHRDWLAKVPEREAEARRILIRTGESPPKLFWFTEEDMIDHKWDNFAAWGMTTLWCENPTDPVLLQGIGALAIWDRYLVVERVMLIAGANREKLGAHFDKLLAHAVSYAPLRQRLQSARRQGKSLFACIKERERHLSAFVRNKTKALPANWARLAKSDAKLNHRAMRDIDIMQLVVALSWAKEPTQARDQGERDRWLEYHRQTLVCALLRIQEVAASAQMEDNDLRDLFQELWPSKDEELLLRRIGKIVANLPVGETSRLLWEPLYAIGTLGERWIDRFNSAWFLEAAAGEHVLPDFTEQWAKFLDYAMASPAWQQSCKYYSSSSDLIEDLLGMKFLGGEFWRAELATALETVWANHEAWAHKNVGSSYHARCFLYFLRYAAAKSLRITGLKILHQHVSLTEKSFWRDEDTAKAFGRFLSLLLTDNGDELAGDLKAREAFLAFALKLTSLQHPLGQELLTATGRWLVITRSII